MSIEYDENGNAFDVELLEQRYKICPITGLATDDFTCNELDCSNVKDDKTGKVLFSNRTLNELIGYDFTGKDSAILIPPTGGVTGYPDSRNQDNVTNWRKYIDSLVKIVDVTEIKIKWLRGEPATVYIVRPVEN